MTSVDLQTPKKESAEVIKEKNVTFQISKRYNYINLEN